MKIENFSKIYLYRVKVYEETTQLPQATSSNSANYNNYFEKFSILIDSSQLKYIVHKKKV